MEGVEIGDATHPEAAMNNIFGWENLIALGYEERWRALFSV